MRRHFSYQAALLGVAGILLTAYVILAIDAAHHQFLPLDRNVREWVQPMRSGGLDLSMETVSFLGEPAGLVPLILIASAVLWRASRRWALLLPILMAGTGVLQLAGKWAVDRPRPNAAPWGFPSGHVLSLVVFFGVVAFLLLTLSERRRRLRFLDHRGESVGVPIGQANAAGRVPGADRVRLVRTVDAVHGSAEIERPRTERIV